MSTSNCLVFIACWKSGWPFQATVLGQQVSVEGLEQTDYDIVARCSNGAHQQFIPLLHLPLPEPPPPGSEWILASRLWRGH